MLAVEVWAKKKSILMAAAGPLLGLDARLASESFRQIKERRYHEMEFPLPDFPSWYARYRSPRYMNEYLASLFELNATDNEDSLSIADIGKILLQPKAVYAQMGKHDLPNPEEIAQLKN
jgi:hypothetical protein